MAMGSPWRGSENEDGGYSSDVGGQEDMIVVDLPQEEMVVVDLSQEEMSVVDHSPRARATHMVGHHHLSPSHPYPLVSEKTM